MAAALSNKLVFRNCCLNAFQVSKREKPARPGKNVPLLLSITVCTGVELITTRLNLFKGIVYYLSEKRSLKAFWYALAFSICSVYVALKACLPLKLLSATKYKYSVDGAPSTASIVFFEGVQIGPG